MKCVNCGAELEFIGCNDTGGTGYPSKQYAYNIYHCLYCFSIHRENVWNNRGLTVLKFDDTVVHLEDYGDFK